MSDLYLKYFAGVRWVELALASGVAVLGDLQLSVQAGAKVDQATLLKALGVGGGVALVYLRMPKDSKGSHADAQDSTEAQEGTLPSGVDMTGPKDDVHIDVLKDAVTKILLPSAGPLASTLASNAVDEVNRFLKRGIKIGGIRL